MELQTSRYNFTVPVEGGGLLYNARTGAIRHFSGSDARDLVTVLSVYPVMLDAQDFESNLVSTLVEGGFLIAPDIDEIDEIRKLFRFAKDRAPIAITITVTQNCNLGCYYCFQKRNADSLGGGATDKIIEHVKTLLESSGKQEIHVNWYGGEPMLNAAFIELTSVRLQNLCDSMGVRYSSSMLTNGTNWPDDPLGFVRRHKISRLQVTFDGFGRSHNKIRRYRHGHASDVDQFEAAASLVDALFRKIKVDVRFNVSPRNREDAVTFAAEGIRRGWFEEGSQAQLQLAKITPYSEAVTFLRGFEIPYSDFEETRDRVRGLVSDRFLDRTSMLDRYPNPRQSVCAAVAQDSVVIGADGNLYNCGLQVGETHRSVGALESDCLSESAALQKEWWDSFDPTQADRCSKCSFLPLCWGACPKLHLEGDIQSLLEQSEYWRTMLPRRLAASLGLEVDPAFRFDERDQFKCAEDGLPRTDKAAEGSAIPVESNW